MESLAAAVSSSSPIPHRTEIRLHAFESYLNVKGEHVHQQQQQRSPSISTDLYTPDYERPPQVYSLNNLPPPDSVAKIVDAFYDCSGVLFHVVPREDCLDWFRSLYWGKAKRTKAVLAELCAVVAVGSQYDSDNFSEEFRKTCFNTVKLYADDVLEQSELSAMRMYACCAMYSIMEKQIAAWSYVVFGLKIAHSHGLHKSECPPNMKIQDWISYRKNWRSLKFFESWLASTLGRLPDGQFDPCSENIEIYGEGESSDTPYLDFDPNALQVELGKIGFLMADILQHVYTQEKLSIKLVGHHVTKLENWVQRMPHFMRLETLLATSVDSAAPRSIFMIHLMYLGSVILSTRKVLVEWATMPVNSAWTCDGTQEEAYHYINMGVVAARHVSRIVTMLLDNRCLLKKCWLVIHQSFSACLLLLSHIVTMKRHRQPRFHYLESLSAICKLLQALQYFATADGLSACYLRLLEPYARALGEPEFVDLTSQLNAIRRAHAQNPPKGCLRVPAVGGPRSPPKTPDTTPPPAQKPKLDQISQDLMDILSKPFGGSADVERSCPPVYENDNHARFWGTGRDAGLEVPAWGKTTYSQKSQIQVPIIRIDKRGLDESPEEVADGKRFCRDPFQRIN
ncbi:hypothetical protein EDC01DRAFT_640846 [Geopyxis carbonaria]|nr:hypothetical protein EDC01DRAFT_640846 [Geopyxis carbonaria]